MKTKKLSISMKFLIAIIVVAMATAGIFGVSRIFAEPTIEDLVADHIHELGTFKPNQLVGKDGDLALVGWLNTTQIMFSYDRWVDTSGDGVIDSEDVYKQDGFEQDMLMTTVLYPILTTGPNNNYYIIPFTDFDHYDGVVVELELGKNSDQAQLKNKSTYWYDRENNYLYIDRNLIQKDLDNEVFNSIRVETIMLVKDIDTATKSINVYTLFASDIDNTHGLHNSTPNGAYDRNIIDWTVQGLHYQLVQPSKLAYVSDENMTVYINGTAIDQWGYNETTGVITIDCSPFTTREVAVKFNKLNDVNATKQTMQMLQATNSEKTGQAATLEEVLTGNNLFLNYIKYTEEPKVGSTSSMGFTAYAELSGKDDVTVSSQTSDGESIPTDIIHNQIKENLPPSAWNDGKMFQSTTLAAYQGVINGEGWDKQYKDEKKAWTEAYGAVAYNMFLAQTKNSTSYVDTALSVIESQLLTSVETTTSTDWHKALTGKWRLDGEEARYITGTMKTNFLGGTLESDSGYAFFDVVCARLSDAALSASAVDEMNKKYGESSSLGYDYRANATIVKIQPNEEGTGGWLYVCVWSKTLLDESEYRDSKESQRILAFSRVPYQYNGGKAKIRLSKVDESTGHALEGAVYGVYSDAACKKLITTITSSSKPVESCELKYGTYYLKEITAPIGYALSQTIQEIKITSKNNKKALDIVVRDEPQQVAISLTVYDQTTENHKVKVPVPGVQFVLKDPDNKTVGTYTTNKDGKITDSKGNTTIYVNAIGDYHFEQIGTVANYAMETSHDVPNKYRCLNIHVEGTPTGTGVNITNNIVHYEQRQTITIKSQVQDADWSATQRAYTPAVLGGTNSALVQTVGAKYQLFTKSEILLGYVNGEPIKIGADQQLTILTHGQINGEKDYFTTAVTQEENGKAYAIASGVKVKYKGDDYAFPLPNGTYQWKLIQSSNGYQNNGATTDISATWSSSTQQTKKLELKNPVLETRQRASLTAFVKWYDDDSSVYIEDGDASLNISYPISHVLRDNVPAGYDADAVKNHNRDNPVTPSHFLSKDYTKTVVVNAPNVTSTSKENVTINKNGQKYVEIESQGLVPNAVYQLFPLCDIVDIPSGTVINALQPIGYYMTDSNGSFVVMQLGTESFINPNENTTPTKIPDAVPLSIENEIGTGDLPNGVYGLSLISVSAKYREMESVLISDWIDVGWVLNKSAEELIEGQLLSFFHYNPTDPSDLQHKIPVAPDPDPDYPNPDSPENPGDPDIPDDPDSPGDPDPDTPDNPNKPSDPYDPSNPDDPDDPDDSEDIPLVTPSWIKDHQYNFAYRISDPDNYKVDANNNAIYDVSDKLPTTFAFVMNQRGSNDGYNYCYALSFYYEISKNEYDAAPEEQINSGEYVKFGEEHARRFATTSKSGGESLTDVIVLNELSEGYISYAEIDKNQSISGAIYNADWLNAKLADQPDGEYKIFVLVDVTESHYDLFSNLFIEKDLGQIYGYLRIKERVLVPLD